MEKVLVVVDMQNDFLTGSLANSQACKIVPDIITLINSPEYEQVIFTQDTHDSNYLDTPEGKALPIPHCIKDTEGWEINEELLKTNKPCSKFVKRTFGSIYLANYISTIPGIKEVTFCGVCTDICVVSNALILKAVAPDLIINVMSDCCAGTTPEKHKAALEVMESCQINVL